MTSRHLNTACGLLGGTFLVLFWWGILAPRWTNSLFGLQGLFFWGGILGVAIILPIIAGIRGSKWWFGLVALSAITIIGTFVLVLK
jgi:hypothetical protein